MDNWYKLSKKKKRKKKKIKDPISPYVMDNGVLKYRTEKGTLMVAEDEGMEKEGEDDWDPNPWAVCTKSVGRDDKEKYERCVKEVKKKQKSKKSNSEVPPFKR